MKYVVAVSGGVDSVVLLDMLVKEQKHELIVAHFDHGIRRESPDDARFVKGLARHYGLLHEGAREQLGSTTSELQARVRRYAFLKKTAQKHNATLVTAHHMDDMIETVAINIRRGTGWRGLSVFGDTSIVRPLVEYLKADILEYAQTHNLEWVQDDTNNSDEYLRNRIRKQLRLMSREQKSEIFDLFSKQKNIRLRIDENIRDVVHIRSRYFFIMIHSSVALEILKRITAYTLTSLQLSAMLHAIKTIKPGNRMSAGSGITIRFTNREFIVENTSKLL